MAIELEDLKKKQAADNEVNWITASFMMLFHIGAIAALFFFTWKAFFVAAFFWWLATSVGIGMCYHRLLTHRGYKDYQVARIHDDGLRHARIEGGPIFWGGHAPYPPSALRPGRRPALSHRRKMVGAYGLDCVGESMHHDTTTLLALRPRPRQRQISRLDHEISLRSDQRPRRNSSRHRRNSIRPLGNFWRTITGLHFTWLVNSATHSWGTRRFKTRDLSTNSWWVAILSWGEGWHNNHHAHPVSARHGLRWYEIDFNWYGIWLMNKLGLARDIYRVKLSALKSYTAPTHEEATTPLRSRQPTSAAIAVAASESKLVSA